MSINFASPAMQPVAIDRPTTYFVALPFESRARAIRVGLANVIGTPYRLNGIACCGSNAWGDMTQPQGQAPWAFFSFTNAGLDSDGVAAPSSHPSSCIVPPNSPSSHNGVPGIPSIYWSDWIDYATTDPVERGGIQTRMFFRVLVPPQTLSMANAVHPDIGTFDIPNARDRHIRVSSLQGDYVTQPNVPVPPPQPADHLPLFVVQYVTDTPGLSIVVGGDSHYSAAFNFVQLAAWQLSTPSLPISVWNGGWAGKPSKYFSPVLTDEIRYARPSVAVIQGWTYNDGNSNEANGAYLARVRQMADLVRAEGGIPLVTLGMPRHLSGTPAQIRWQQANTAISALSPGIATFDPNPVVMDKANPGNWLPRYSDDGVHANLAGSIALAGAFLRLLGAFT